MNRVVATLGAGAISLALASAVYADQTIQWRQVLNLPKGANLPGDVKVDIVGIELGDTINTVRGKIKGLTKEQIGERNTVMRLSTGGGPIDAQFLSRLGATYGDKSATGTLESVTVLFSTPASGSQALHIVREIFYHDQAKQPLIADVLSQLSRKLKATPIPAQFSNGDHYLFVFHGGRPVTPGDCVASFPAAGPSDIDRINPSGQCDVVYEVKFVTGITKDHASAITFTLADNERMKQTARADFGFFDSFVKNVQGHAGAVPRL